jgi:hypothetical protein
MSNQMAGIAEHKVGTLKKPLGLLHFREKNCLNLVITMQ